MYEENTATKIFSTKLTANDSTAKETLGAVRELEDGRKFRYAKMTGSAGDLGRVYTVATKVSLTDITSADGVGPDGATTTVITDPSQTAWTVDQYKGWYFKVDTGKTGSEEPIKIVGSGVNTLTLEKQLTTACVSTDDGEIIAPLGTVKKSVVDQVDDPVSGVGIGTITENYFGWIQTKGYAAVLSTSALSEGDVCTGGGATTAGQAADRAGADDQLIGTCIAAGGTNDFQLVALCID